MSYHVAILVSMCVCLTVTIVSAFDKGAVLLYASVCSLPCTKSEVFFLWVGDMFCFLKCENLHILVVILAMVCSKSKNRQIQVTPFSWNEMVLSSMRQQQLIFSSVCTHLEKRWFLDVQSTVSSSVLFIT